MTLIEALKVNGKARIKGKDWYVYREDKNCIVSHFVDLEVAYNYFERDDWEPMTGRYLMVAEGYVEWRPGAGGSVFPFGRIEGIRRWEDLVGKTTKIRIEWEE